MKDTAQSNTGGESILRARAEQMESIFALFAISQELEQAEKIMAKRIGMVKHGLRDIRLLRSVADRLVSSLCGTLPVEKRESVLVNARYMTYDVHFDRFKASVPAEKNFAMVNSRYLDTLIGQAKSYCCLGCNNRCSSCDIGKALDHIMIQCRRPDESWERIDLNEDHADD